MIISLETPEVEKYRVHDCRGFVLPLVQSYNTETKELVVSLRAVGPEVNGQPELSVIVVPHDDPPQNEDGSYNFSPVTVSFVLPCSFATFDGKIIGEGNGPHQAFALTDPLLQDMVKEFSDPELTDHAKFNVPEVGESVE